MRLFKDEKNSATIKDRFSCEVAVKPVVSIGVLYFSVFIAKFVRIQHWY